MSLYPEGPAARAPREMGLVNGAKEWAERDVRLRSPFRESGFPLTTPTTAEQIATLRDRRRVYIEYARHRIDDEDWHGVSDAANDLRELDVEIRMLDDRR